MFGKLLVTEHHAASRAAKRLVRGGGDDVRVRQALNYAVNANQVLSAEAGGYGSVLSGPLSPANLYADPGLSPYGYDPEKARALLLQAGYRVRCLARDARKMLVDNRKLVEREVGNLENNGAEVQRSLVVQAMAALQDGHLPNVVYGVATDYCLKDAVLGLVKTVPRVLVVEDAIRAVDPAREQQALEEMKAAGAVMITVDRVADMMEEDGC